MGYYALAIFEELHIQGYRGNYKTGKRFVGPLCKEAEIDATVLHETPPGR